MLAELRSRHGDHPVLLETEADFTDDPATQRELYRRALQQAELGGLITYSIRISLARVLLDNFKLPDEALAELMACEAELEPHADAAEQQKWAELVGECREQVPRGRI